MIFCIYALKTLKLDTAPYLPRFLKLKHVSRTQVLNISIRGIWSKRAHFQNLTWEKFNPSENFNLSFGKLSCRTSFSYQVPLLDQRSGNHYKCQTFMRKFSATFGRRHRIEPGSAKVTSYLDSIKQKRTIEKYATSTKRFLLPVSFVHWCSSVER